MTVGGAVEIGPDQTQTIAPSLVVPTPAQILPTTVSGNEADILNGTVFGPRMLWRN